MTEFEEVKESHNKIPLGWLLFFIGIIIWLVFYIYAYLPGTTGWSQYKVLEEEMKAAPQPAKTEMLASNPYSGDKAAAEEGEELYEQNCAACHGEDLEGVVGPPLTGELTYGASDKELFTSVNDGRPNGMPGFGQQLGADRVWKVVAYINHERSEGDDEDED